MMVAMRYGVARGVYANEAGYGTAAVAYATARSGSRSSRASTRSWRCYRSFVTRHSRSPSWSPAFGERARPARRGRGGFFTTIPKGGWIVGICAFLFGYTTLIGWAYYGEQFLEYVFGKRVTVPYR